MSKFFDNLETRSDSERSNDIGEQLPVQIKNAKEKFTMIVVSVRKILVVACFNLL